MSRLVAIDVFRIKIIQFLLLLIFILNFLLTLLQTYMFFKKFDTYYFIKFAPGYFVLIQVMLCLTYVPYITQTEKDVQRIQWWEIDSADSVIENQINKKSRRTNCYIISMTFLTIIAGILFNVPLKCDKEIFYPFAIFEDYSSTLQQIFSWFYYKIQIILGFIMVSVPCFHCMYYVSHAKFQACMLGYYVKRLNADYDDIDGQNLIQNEEYQREIKKRLLFCISRGQSLLIASQLLKNGEKFVLFFKITGFSVLISASWFVFSVGGVYTNLFVIRTGLVCILIILSFLSLLKSGQEFEDLAPEIFNDLASINWYNWNKENKQLYLISLAISQQEVKIKFSENLSLNYARIEIAEILYTVVVTVSQFRNDTF